MWLREPEKILCALIFLGMTGIGFVNVAVRYLTDRSFAATEELLVNGFLLLTVLGAAIAARRGDHLAVTILYDVLPRGGRVLLLWVSTALGLALLLLSAWFCWRLLMYQLESGTVSYALQLPAWYYTVGLPFAFVLVAVRYVQHALCLHAGMAGERGGDA
ncbi:MAG TPA: TRAP transporter small permease [Pararhizobium sp.]|nr:TRAP transporter small permease [Pararhizobium sp.]